MKNKLIYYLGLIVSLTFLYFVFRGINIHHLLGVLSSIKPVHALLVAVLSVFLIVFKTVRWKMFLDRIEKVSYKKLLSINMMSNMFNILLPLRAGELFQIFMTKTETNANFERSKVAGTLVLNKVFELLSLLILCYVLTWFINLPAVWVVPVRFLVFFIIAFLLLFAFNVVNLKKIAIPKNRFLKVAYNFLMSLKLIEDKLLLLKTLMLSFFIWGIELSMINILFTAFNLSFPFWVSIFVLISINLAMLIPATNASFGPYEYAIVIVLTMYGVSKEIALSFAVALHFLEIIFVLLLGLMFYLKMRRKESCLVQ